MKKNILFSLFLLIFLNTSVFSDFSNYTTISGDTFFNKLHGTNSSAKNLYLYEDYYINPFAGTTIVINSINGVVSSYSINGVVFTKNSSLFRSAGYTAGWKDEGNGIKTKIDYLENTYSSGDGFYIPRQNVKVRKYYEAKFQHDTTPPTCGDLKIYNDELLTKPFTYNGGWVNVDKFYTMRCVDLDSGCKCSDLDPSCEIINGNVVTKPEVLGHLSSPTASFINNVNLRNPSCTGYIAKKLMYDKSAVEINLSFETEDQKLWAESNRTYQTSGGKKYDGIEISGKIYYTVNSKLEKKANDGFLTLDLSDKYIPSSMHGVSGIKNYNISIYRKEFNQSNFPSETYYDKSSDFAEYNKDGIKQVTDTKKIKFTDLSFSKSGNYKMIINSFDWAGNETKVTFYYNVFPGDVNLAKSKIELNGNVNEKYADNASNYSYTVFLKDKYGNPIYNKNLNLINQSCEGITNCNTLTTNMSNNTGDDALIEYGYGNKLDILGKTNFNLKALSPGIFNQRFKVVLNKWDDNNNNLSETQVLYFNNSLDNSFKKPYSGQLYASKDNGVTWNDVPEVGTTLKYKLQLTTIPSLENISINLNNFKSYIGVTDTVNNILQQVSDISGLTTMEPIFSARINTSPEATSLGIPGIKISDNSNKTPIIISYNLGGKNISYYLSTSNISDSRDVIRIDAGGENFMGIKVIGTLQGAGKLELTGQESNFSDISTTDIRTLIRKNAYSQISSMKTNQIVNGIKYIEGNVTLSGNNFDYETLVVKNGNVIISGDLNTSGKTLGIIVLKDNYNVNTDFLTAGNVYVKPDVTKINAIIYADGGFISADNSGIPYVKDSEQRTSILNKQLFLNGTLFTRNTIGGGMLAGGKYILPGGSKIDDFDKAMLYDLNFLRRGNLGCDKNSNGTCSDIGEYKNFFIIKYDSNIQLNPPKLFK